jgi:hypothetical protein
MHHRSNHECRHGRAACQVAADGPVGDLKLSGHLGLTESCSVKEFTKIAGFHLANLGQIVLGHNFLARGARFFGQLN